MTQQRPQPRASPEGEGAALQIWGCGQCLGPLAEAGAQQMSSLHRYGGKADAGGALQWLDTGSLERTDWNG